MGLANKIRSFEVFNGCSDSFIENFSKLAHERSVPAGTTLLTEGAANDRLVILTTGEAEVSVNGEKVADLRTPGDLIGEISVLTGRLATATIMTRTPVSFFEINGAELNAFLQASQNDFGFQLYRSISRVLSNKIISTNEKARQFEIANRSLVEVNRNLDEKVRERTKQLEDSYQALETQNFEVLASHRKLEELYSAKENTFMRLSELQDALVPLLDSLRNLSQKSSGPARDYVDQVSGQLENSIELLRPMNELYSTEQAVKSRRVLVIEPDRKQQVISKMALGGTGVRLDVAANEEEAHACLQNGRYDLVFISSDLANFVPEVRKKWPTANLVMMASSNVPDEIPRLKEHVKLVPNIVSRNPEDRTFTVKNIATTVTKLITKDLFGLEKYMIWGVEVHERPVQHSEQRKDLIEQMCEHFKSIGVRSTVTDRIATVAEEMLMNAIYDAPVAADGTTVYAGVARTSAVQLKPEEFGEFRFACDGMLAAISVSDPFGRFRMETLINYLERNYSNKDGGSIQEPGKGGAGRGLHQIIEGSDLVVFNVKKNSRTEVIALFNLDPRAKDLPQNPTFHFFAAE